MFEPMPQLSAAMDNAMIQGTAVSVCSPSIIVPKLMKQGKTIVSRAGSGVLKPGCLLSELVDGLDGMRDMSSIFELHGDSGEWTAMLLAGYDIALRIRVNLAAQLAFTAIGSPDAIVDVFSRLTKWIDPIPPSTRERGRFYMLVSRRGNHSFQRIGSAGEPFIPANYGQDPVESFKPLVQWLSSPEPSGRLVLMAGPTGTGKTYYLRALMQEADVRWVLVPPGVLRDLANPSMIEALAAFSRKDQEMDVVDDDGDPIEVAPRPAVLIIEDADATILRRQDEERMEAMPELSTLLNLGEGLLGSAMNIRMLLTCNLPIESVDEAVRRDGRMFRKVEFSPLSAEHAGRLVRHHLGAGASLPTSEMTLTKVYTAIRRGKVEAETTQPVAEPTAPADAPPTDG